MSIPLKIETLCGGGLLEALQHEMQNVLANCADPNTEAKKMREVRMVIKIKPNEQRNMADVFVQTSSKLVPAAPLESSIIIDKDNTGAPVAAELWVGENPMQAELPDVEITPRTRFNFPNKGVVNA